MSAMLLYHMLGIRGYSLVREKVVEGGMEFHIALDRGWVCCPDCGSSNVWLKGSQVRKFRSVPIGSKKTKIALEVPRVHCLDCQCTKQVSISFAKPNKRYTRFFERHVLDLLCSMTCQDVAKHLGVSWDTVRDIEKTKLERDFAKPPLKDVTHIAIDEIAVRKGHKQVQSSERRVQSMKLNTLNFALPKGIRFSLLKREENLNVAKGEHQKLENALSLNADLAVAHTLKGQLAELWETDDEDERFASFGRLDRGCRMVGKSRKY